MVYLDTGCLVKLYYPEEDSARVVAKCAGQSIVFSPLNNLELTSALKLKIFRQEATDLQVRSSLKLVTEDIADGKLIAISNVNGSTLDSAVHLANKYASAIGSRSLDTLHWRSR